MTNVLCLCKCLKENDFSVGLDARESHLLRKDSEKISWHDMRYDKVGSMYPLLSYLLYNSNYTEKKLQTVYPVLYKLKLKNGKN